MSSQETLEQVKKHHFWILAGVMLLMAIICWWLGVSAIADQTDKLTKQREQSFQAVQAKLGRPYHPNQSFIEQMDQKIVTQSNEVYQAWKSLYERQQQRVLQWPKDLPETERNLLVTGEFFNLSLSHPNSKRVREVYQNTVDRIEEQRLRTFLQLLEPLPVVEDPNNPQTSEGIPGSTGYGQEKKLPECEGLVHWADFDSIFAAYPWLQEDRLPQPFEIKYCQEDIWCYLALFDLIAKTNEGVDDYRKAWIKQIVALEIGQAVAPPAASLMNDLRKEASSGSSEGGAYGGLGEGSPSGGLAGETGESEMTMEELILDRRYVDGEGKPLRFNEQSPNPEYNLIPFRMVLGMDQRRVGKLLAACADSELPIEVRSCQMFKWNEEPPVGQQGFQGGGRRARSGYGSFGEGGGGSRLGGSSSSRGQDNRNLPNPDDYRSTYDVKVEIRGELFLYKKPSLEALQEYASRAQQQDGENPSASQPGTNVPPTGDPASGPPVEPTPAQTTPAEPTPSEPAPGEQPPGVQPPAEPAGEPPAGENPTPAATPPAPANP